MNSTIEMPDGRLRDDVMQELAWDPEFDAAHVAVTVEDGAVRLTGFVDTYVAKVAAERAARRVVGVRTVANDIQVTARLGRTDSEIAREALQTLERSLSVPDRVKVTVCEGIVTLDGTVDSLFQKSAAESALTYVHGMRGIENFIAVDSSKAA